MHYEQISKARTTVRKELTKARNTLLKDMNQAKMYTTYIVD